MKQLQRVQPNFKCTVVDPTGAIFTWLLAAANRAELQQRFARSPFKLTSIQDYSLQEWVDRCKPEQDRANAQYATKDFQFKNDLWTEVKQFLFSLSDNCCGYCETTVRVASAGHVEHYRPKRGVTEDRAHPGYYWLAYELDNYVPSCENCNSTKKGNHFPLVSTSPRATDAVGISAETPLLLNPFVHTPHQHLRFVADQASEQFGWILGTDEIGEMSERIYGLNRGDLVGDRRKEFTDILKQLQSARQTPEDIRREIVDNVKSGKGQYTFAARAAVVHWDAQRVADETRRIETERAEFEERMRIEQAEFAERRKRMQARLAEMENDRQMLLAAA